MGNRILEVCCYSVQSAINAQRGGAARIELCQGMAEGGTTPSFATIKRAKALLSIKVNVIIRPRGGDFLYSDQEFEVMKEDVLMCKSLGVDGVVIGLLHANGTVDATRTAELVRLARPMSVTFHRAFDMTVEPFAALDTLIEVGIDRILTSGQEQTADKGAVLLQKLVAKANGKLVIMPGSGVNEGNIQMLMAQTQATEYHLSAKALVKGAMAYRNPRISMGGVAGLPEYDTYESDEATIRRIVELIK